jgi:hypothetical protein
MNSSCGTPGSLRALIASHRAMSLSSWKPLEFIKLIHRDEHRRRLPVLGQHNTLMAAPGTIDQLGEMTASLRNRARKRHSSTVPPDADLLR